MLGHGFRIVRAATTGVGPGEADGINPGTQEIRLDPQNEIGLFQSVVGKRLRAVGLFVSRRNGGTTQGVVDEELSILETIKEVLEGGLQCGAGQRSAQDAELAAFGFDLREPRGQIGIEGFPIAILTRHARLPEPGRIVKAAGLGLADGAKPAAVQGMIGIPFEFHGPPIPAAGQHAAARGTALAGGGIPLRHTGGQVFLRVQIGQCLLHRFTLATDGKARRKANARKTEEVAPGDLAHAHAYGEFIAELGLGLFDESPPFAEALPYVHGFSSGP